MHSARQTSSSPLLEVNHVSFRYPGAARPALQNVSLAVHAGDRVLVIGHNGSGKSTLLSLLGGRRKPQKSEPVQAVEGKEAGKNGQIRVMGADPFDDTSMGRHVALIGAPWPAEAYFGNTVDCVASPAPSPDRKSAIAAALHLRVTRRVDSMSAGEKRRVQILHGMLNPATIFLLDECSTDIDVAERKTVLALVKRECEERGGCCLYATHILDRVQDWATHLLLMKDGRVVSFMAVGELQATAEASSAEAGRVSLEQFVLQFMSEGGPDQGGGGALMSSPVARYEVKSFLDRGTSSLEEHKTASERTYFAKDKDSEVVIDCRALTYRDVFKGASFQVYRGERVLLCGCNGAGKSTLLNMLGGKQFFNNADGALKVLGKNCYDDMTLNAQVAYGGDWWTAVPGGEVHVREMLTISTPRAERLRAFLAVNLDWDVRHISSGEQKRVQILLHLLQDKPIILLDEATADLDVDQRHALLSFLFAESVCRGVTVIYSTHIFGGLEGWADTVVLLDRTVRGVHAVWRKRQGDSVSLDRVAKELIVLKAREEF